MGGQYENGEVPSTELSRWKSVYENQESLYNGPNLYKYDLNIHEVLKSLLMVNAPSEQLNFDNVLKSLTNSQSTQFINYNLDVLTNKDIILKIGNPSKYNNKVYQYIFIIHFNAKIVFNFRKVFYIFNGKIINYV